jgi:hypothetical protein
MRVVVNDEKAQPIEVDAYHKRQWLAGFCPVEPSYPAAVNTGLSNPMPDRREIKALADQ